MSSIQAQEQRKAEAMSAAVEAIREAGVPTPHLDAALAEPLIADENRLVAIVAEQGEEIARLRRAYNHTADHVDPSQDREIERLRERVDKLEAATGG